MKKFFLSLMSLVTISVSTFAQTVYIPGGEYGNSTNSGIGIGTDNPTDFVHIQGKGISPYLKIDRVGISGPPYGSYGIKIGTNGRLFSSIYPDCGSGSFIIKGDDYNGNTIMFRNNVINFGDAPNCFSGRAGTFNFGGGNVWVRDVLVVSSYNRSGSGMSNYTLPTGYKLAVNGSASFKDSVVIGNYESFTQGLPSGYRLFVAEGILTEKVKVAVKTTTDWADYVFSDNYTLMPLKDVEHFVRMNNHLPNVPSAQEVVNSGIDIAKMDAKLLEKIEELTLYIIEQNKRIEELQLSNRRIEIQVFGGKE